MGKRKSGSSTLKREFRHIAGRIHYSASRMPVLFFDPGGRPRFFTGASLAATIHAGGRPLRLRAPIAIRSRLSIASSTC